MHRCPKCDTPVTEEQFSKGFCPACHAKETPRKAQGSKGSSRNPKTPTPLGLSDSKASPEDGGGGSGIDSKPSETETLDPARFAPPHPVAKDLDDFEELPPTLIQSTRLAESQATDADEAPPQPNRSAQPSTEPPVEPKVETTDKSVAGTVAITDTQADATTEANADEKREPLPESEAQTPSPKKPFDRSADTARPNLEETLVQDQGGRETSKTERGGASDDLGSTWKGGFASSVSPMSTITGRDVEEVREEGLIIRKRRLRSKDASDIDEADYRVVRQIGKGGMGRVHLAIQTALNRRVAVKELNPKTARDPQNRRKFLAEAAITGELDHPNIVPVHDVGVNSDGRLFYSMKMISGKEWQDRIKHNSLSDNIDILMKVADAVSFAHSRNVIHRDLKPENVMLGGFGEVLVTDWGLAVHLGGEHGFVAGGTPCYMAPEMAAHYIKVESERNPVAREHFEATLPSGSHALVNDRLAPIDKRSDIYLLGAILFHIATGAPPHTGKSVSDCLALAVSNELATRKYENELTAIAQKAMATDPADRYASVEALQLAIREHQTHNQSIALSAKAQEDLELAERDGHYEQFQRAMFGFQEAADLWPKNTRAIDGIQTAKIAYARRALGKNDFDLGLQLLSPNVADENALHQRFVKGAKERDSRARRIKFFRTSAAVCALLLIAGGLFFLLTMSQKNLELAHTNEELDDQKTVAEDNAEKARNEAIKATAAEATADKQRGIAVKQKEKAEAATDDATKQREIAVEQKEKAEAATKEAEENRTLAESREMIAQTGRFAATFSLAKTYINANDADRAARQLVMLRKQDAEFNKRKEGNEGLKSLIDWEWHRLDYLCHSHDPRFGVTEMEVDGGAVTMGATPDGRRIVVGTADNRVQIYERGTDDPIAEISVPDDEFCTLRTAAISPDGRLVAIGGAASGRAAHSFQLWDLGATSPKLVFEASPHSPNEKSRRLASDVFSVAFSSDGRKIVAGCSEGIAVWTQNGDESWNSKANELGRSGDYKSVRFVPSPPGAENDVIRIVGVARYRLQDARHQGASVFELTRRTGKQVSPENGWKWASRLLDSIYGAYNTVDVSTVDPHLVALGAPDGSVVLWIWVEPTEKANSGRRQPPVTVELLGHTRAVRDVVFSQANGPDGQHTLVTASDDQTLIAWDLSRLGVVERRRADAAENKANQGRTLWKATQSRRIPPFRGHTDAVIACCYATGPSAQSEGSGELSTTEDSTEFGSINELISTAANGSIRRWSLDRYRDERLFEHSNKNMACTAAAAHASENGLRVATAGADGHAKVWDAATGQLLADLVVGHERNTAVVPKATIVDGEIRIITCGRDGQMCIWDGKTGKPLSVTAVIRKELIDEETRQATISFAGQPVIPFDVSPDGQLIATGEGSNGTHDVAASLWNVGTGERAESDLFKAAYEGDRFSIPSKRLAFAGSAHALLISTRQGRVYVWNKEADRASEVIFNSSKPAAIGVFRTPDNQHDITVGTTSLQIWPAFEARKRPGKPLQKLMLPYTIRQFYPAATSDDAAFVLLTKSKGGQDGPTFAIELWNRQSLIDGKRIASREGRYLSASISADGKTILAVPAKGKRDAFSELVRWDWQNNLIDTLLDRGNPIPADNVIFVGTGHFLTMTGRRQSPAEGPRGWQGRLWKLEAGEGLREEARFTSRSEIQSIRFSPDASEVVTMSADGAIRAWPISNLSDGPKPSRPVPSRQVSDLEFSTVKRLILSPEGDLVLSLNQTGDTMRIWNRQTGEKVSTTELPGRGIDAHWIGDRIAVQFDSLDSGDNSHATGGSIRMWDERSGMLTRIKLPEMKAVQRMALVGDGHETILATTHVVAGTEESGVSIWQPNAQGTWSDATRIPADGSRVTAIAFSPSGRRLVMGECGGNVVVWRVDSGPIGNQGGDATQSGPLLTLRRHAAAVTSIHFSNDGHHLVTTDAIGKAVFWPTSGWAKTDLD